jgi:hypothetical protein
MGDISDGKVVALKGGDDGTRMYAWEMIERTSEPTMRVACFVPSDGVPEGREDDSSDGIPRATDSDSTLAMKMHFADATVAIPTLTLDQRLQLVELLGRLAEQWDPDIYVQVFGTRGHAFDTRAIVVRIDGTVIKGVRVDGWRRFREFLAYCQSTCFVSFRAFIEPEFWNGVYVVLEGLATTAQEWTGKEAPDGSMVLRLEER